MVAFNAAQLEAVIGQINGGLTRVDGMLAQIGPTAQAAVSRPNIPAAIKNVIISLARGIENIARAVVRTIVDLMKGATAPIWFWQDSTQWTDIRSRMSKVHGSLKPGSLLAELHWKGAASDAYQRQNKPQGEAAMKLVVIAGSISTSLATLAAAGLAFYVGVGFALAQFIAAMAAAIAAIASGVLSPMGAAIAYGNVHLTIGEIAALVGAVTALIGGEISQINAMANELGDSTFFPGGKWPDAVTSTYNDGSARDGDPSDWEFKR